MSCSQKNVILISAEAALTAFESFVPVLEQAGRLNPTLAGQIQTYVSTSTTTLNGVITELESNDATLPKIAASIQTVIAGFNQFSGAVPPGINITVNLVNAGLQTLLFAIEQQIALSAPAVGPVVAAPAVATAAEAHALAAPVTATGAALAAATADGAEKIHSSIFERGHLKGMKDRMAKVAESVGKLTAEPAK